MNPYLGLALGVVVGGVAGVIVGLLVGRRSARSARPARSDTSRTSARGGRGSGLSLVAPVVPDGTDELLDVLGSAAVLVGPHDEVLRSTGPARSFGLVHGDRVALEEILALVRTARERADVETADLVVRRGASGMVARPESADHGQDRSAATGTWYWSVRAAPLRDGLVLLLVEDRTAVRRADQTRHDFVVNVSHELKTPIGAMLLLAETIQTANDDAEAVQRFAGRLITEAERLDLLVRQLINLSRLQSDDEPIAHVPVAIDDVLTGAVDRCRVEATRRGVSLTRTGEHGLVVSGDAAELENAIGNLVENAITYSDTGGRVAVAARQLRAGSSADGAPGTIEISVSDNGIGIAEADQERIFERFYRVDYARSRDNGGTGLGLSIVKHVVAGHDGTVQVWSRPGQGSTFTVRLPGRPDLSSDDAASTSSEPPGSETPVGGDPDHPGHPMEETA